MKYVMSIGTVLFDRPKLRPRVYLESLSQKTDLLAENRHGDGVLVLTFI